MCVGVCLQAYHPACVGLQGPDLPPEWWCAQCESGRMRCFACGGFGNGIQDNGMRKCSMGVCGRFYHTQCASCLVSAGVQQLCNRLHQLHSDLISTLSDLTKPAY